MFYTASALFASLNFDLVELSGITCHTHVSYYKTLVVTFLIPILTIGGFVAIHLIAKRLGHDYENWCWQRAIVIMFMVYPNTSQKMFLTFKCREIEGHYWLEQDLELECFTSERTGFATIALMGILIYTVGVPLGTYILLN